ncbi:MAG: hypothetical protein FJ315_09285, partial [SAR202 cluster bacterium]|nr:hypothetical protein [SAR202 cluster bacterium]
TIHLREGAVESDVEELDRLLRRAAAAPHPLEQRRWYSEALELYQGEFLPGWYEDWCLVEREHLEGKYRAALRRLLTLWEQDGNQEAALECALEIARREPLDEEARREVLRLLLALGRVEEALREYLDLEGRLRDMLQTRPSRATLAWRDLVLSPQSDMFRVPIPVETRRAAVRERPAGLPRGAWTFLAVETLAGDTALHRVSAAADRMRGELLRREPGRVVAAFPGVAAALEAALACYREAEGPERHCLRAGLHTAEVREAGPQGLPPLLEKLLAAGHPGQLLASEATLGLLRTGAGSPSEAASPGAAWRDLGLHRFGADGAEQWVRLFQGCHPVLPDRPFPPLRGATRPGTALAPATNAFFGREQELALLHEWVRAGPEGGRLLTVTGPGGAGKTRVTLEALRRVEQEGQRIVWYVPLQSVRVSAGLPEAVCSALGCPSPSFGSSPLEQAAAVLNSSPSLLVLDNLEQLWGEATAALLIRLLAQAPTVSILVTSRQRLELEGEQELE